MITRALSLIVMLLLCVPAIAQSTTKQKVQQAEGRIKLGGMSVKKTTTPKLLVLEKNGEEVKKNWEDLSQGEIQALAAEFDRCDLEQFQLVQPHLAQLVANPQATIDILKSVHVRMYESPYAGLWTAVAMSAGTNKYEDAGRVLQQVKNWIEVQRIVNPKAHRQTLASALNNLAVCNIKDGNGSSAANHLANALNINEATTPVLAHNVRQLLAMPDIATMSLTKPSRTKLTEALTNVPVRAVETKMRDGWHYSLDFDLPKGGIGAENVPGLEPPVAGMELVSIGTGVVLSPGVVVTARSNITKEYLGAISVACLVDKKWDSRTVRSVIYERPRLEVAKTEALSIDGVTGVKTTFHVIDPSPGLPSSEIAALAVGNLPVKPAMIAKEEPKANDTLTLKNYSRALENLSLGVVSSQSASRINGTTIELTDTVQGGAIGGGLFNADGAFVGMVYDYPDNSLIKAFGVGEVSSWYRSHVKSAELIRDNGTAQSRADASVVLVLTWRRRPQEDRTRQLYIALTDPSKPSGQLYMIDDWCISCKGDGMVPCPNCKGLGSVTVSGQVAAGVDFKNNPMTQQRNFRAPCPNCKGRQAFACPSCQAGRLRIPPLEK